MVIGWLVGCSGDGGDGDGDGRRTQPAPTDSAAADAAPLATLDPGAVDFGTRGPGEDATAEVVVTNAGDAPFAITSVATTGDAFAATGAPGEVGPGEERVITVSFAPTAAMAYAGTLTVGTDDPAHPSLGASLVGVGRPAWLEVAPTVEWPTAWVPCVSEVEVELANTGFDDLVVTWEPLPPPFEVGADAPVELRPGRATTIPVRLRPTETGDWTVDWALSSNDPRGTSIVSIHAAATEVVATCPD